MPAPDTAACPVLFMWMWTTFRRTATVFLRSPEKGLISSLRREQPAAAGLSHTPSCHDRRLFAGEEEKAVRESELKQFRKLLQEERQRIIRSLAKRSRIIEHTESDSGGGFDSHDAEDPADRASDEYEYESNIQFASAEGQYLREIDDALSRIEEGTYGTCERCGKPISKARLQVLPTARLDVDCQEQEDTRRYA
jgi:DnaK suppressor protein